MNAKKHDEYVIICKIIVNLPNQSKLFVEFYPLMYNKIKK